MTQTPLGPRRRRLLAASLVVPLLTAALACVEQSSQILDVDAPPDTTDPSGTVQRIAITITVQATAGTEAAVVAGVLDWQSGAISAAEIAIRRVGGGESALAVADARGSALFTDLLPGTYSIQASRILTESERAAVRTARPDLSEVNAFGAGANFTTGTADTSFSMPATAGRPGSLVISEMYHYAPLATSGNVLQYGWADYIEVFNNADTTIYLDGKILGQGLFNIYEDERFPCTTLERWRTDPTGVWSEWHFRFPGSGTRFPLEPGETAVIATDAIDHGEFRSGTPDLSEANFETLGSPDLDNPQVPNMVQAGVRLWDSALGHGYTSGWGTLFIAADIDLDALPQADLPLTNPRYRLIPADAILDVATLLLTPEERVSFGTIWCTPVVSDVFDRVPAELLDEFDPTTVRRKVLASLSNGRIILQRTGTSAADLQRGPRSPGKVP